MSRLIVALIAIAATVGAGANASAGPQATTSAVAKPTIHKMLIPYPKKRKREMAAYSKHHYGQYKWRLNNPKLRQLRQRIISSRVIGVDARIDSPEDRLVRRLRRLNRTNRRKNLRRQSLLARIHEQYSLSTNLGRDIRASPGQHVDTPLDGNYLDILRGRILQSKQCERHDEYFHLRSPGLWFWRRRATAWPEKR